MVVESYSCVCVCAFCTHEVLHNNIDTSYMSLPHPITEALKTFGECREKEPTLQKELNEVKNAIERKCKEIELAVSMRIKWTSMNEVNSRGDEPTPTHPYILPTITKSPTRKDPALKMLYSCQSISEDNTTSVPVVQVLVQKTPVEPAVEASKSVDQRQPSQKNTFEKTPEVVSMPHVDSDDLKMTTTMN